MGIIEASPRLVERYNLHGAAVLAHVSPSNTIPVRLLNPTAQPTTIYRETTLDTFQSCGEHATVVNLQQERVTAIRTGDVQPWPTPSDPSKSEPFVDLSGFRLTHAQQSQLTDLLQEYRYIFVLSPDELGRTSLIQHEIDTGTHPPIRLRPYRSAQVQRERIEVNINDIIQPSTGPWGAPVVLVKKKDGSDGFCVD